MTYLLDTNVVSESQRKKPNKAVMAWLDSINEAELFLSRITIGEIHAGAEKLRGREPRRSSNIENWLAEIETFYDERILPLTDSIIVQWGKLYAFNKSNPIDMLIAATAIEHHLVVVTRNTKDFQQTGLELLNPWQE